MGAALAGAGYQALATARDARTYPPPGRLVDVGGFRLHLICSGSAPAGEPTVVLDAALGHSSLYWMRVLPELTRGPQVTRAAGAAAQDGVAQAAGDAERARSGVRACAYDRAGLGWSDPSPRPRSAEHLADELRGLLRAAAEPGPYVLVGSSLGGYVVRVYASRYPSGCTPPGIRRTLRPSPWWTRFGRIVTRSRIPSCGSARSSACWG